LLTCSNHVIHLVESKYCVQTSFTQETEKGQDKLLMPRFFKTHKAKKNRTRRSLAQEKIRASNKREIDVYLGREKEKRKKIIIALDLSIVIILLEGTSCNRHKL